MMASDQALRDDAPATTARDDDRREAAASREGEDSIIGRTVTINRPHNEIYDFWRDFANLALVMENVERIDTLGGGVSAEMHRKEAEPGYTERQES